LDDFRREFLALCVECGALRFGEFTLKSGRISPYFFNAGVFNDGARLRRLGEFYAAALAAQAPPFDLLFGPAYKGIPLACATAIALAGQGRSVPWAFDRKEAKDHGEGGTVVGAPLAGRVMVVDDVISSGLSVAHSVALIAGAGAHLAGVVVALDRQERGQDGAASATAQVAGRHGVPVLAIARLEDLLGFLAGHPRLGGHRDAVSAYRDRYGASA
jgi:orotate phosphoribosyltransferase